MENRKPIRQQNGYLCDNPSCGELCELVYESMTSESGRRLKISLSRLAEKNPMWKGDKAGYDAIHIWVKRRKLKPKLCGVCKTKEPHDLANISQKYERDLDDWEYLCRKCHMQKDGRLNNLILTLKKWKLLHLA